MNHELEEKFIYAAHSNPPKCEGVLMYCPIDAEFPVGWRTALFMSNERKAVWAKALRAQADALEAPIPTGDAAA